MVTSGLSPYQHQPANHREACVFGSGFWKIRLRQGLELTFDTFAQAEDARMRLPPGSILGLSRDGYCLDPQDFPDVVQRQVAPLEPPIVDGELWLGMPPEQQMQVLGLTDEADLARTQRAVEEMVSAAVNRLAQTGVKVSVVIKKKGQRVIDL
jgi:hypothetical protein